MAEYTFKAFGKEKTLRRTIKLVRKTLDQQRKLQNFENNAKKELEQEDFNPATFIDKQEKELDCQIKYLSEIFKKPVKEFEDEDPIEIVNTVNDIYFFALGKDDDEQDGVEPGEA